ncbi:MAG TPA: PAS domain S-box protein [Steroidobacteraceae bacterium]|jgi:PAS domain S-box-containing protein|nr:PAS domain S-box protein [Steroidobacteraceae bacterium]
MKNVSKYALLPVTAFAIVAASAFYLNHVLTRSQDSDIKRIVAERADTASLLLASESRSKVSAIRRMGQRWETAGGTAQSAWREDVSRYLADFRGLRAVAWIDDTGQVRWIEPAVAAGEARSLAALLTDEGAAALQRAPAQGGIAVTPASDLVAGYKAFVAFVPLTVRGRANGTLAAIFDTHEFLGSAIWPAADGFTSTVIGAHGVIFRSEAGTDAAQTAYAQSATIAVYDRSWTLRLVPTRAMVARYRSSLPQVVLALGILIALLLAGALRAALEMRLRARRLADANKFNDAIMSSTADLIIATDVSGVVRVFNRAAERALGYQAAEVIGKKTTSLWHDPREVQERANALSKELGRPVDATPAVFFTKGREQGYESSECTYIRSDGTSFPVHMTATRLRNADEDLTGYLGVSEDITVHRAAKLSQQQAEEKLRLSEQRYRMLIDGVANYAIYWLDPDGRITSWNAGARNLKQYTEAEVLGQHYSIFFAQSDRDAGLPEHALREAARYGKYVSEGWRVRKDGSRFWASVLLEPIRDAQGAIMGFAKISHDESARREMDQRLLDTAQELDAVLATMVDGLIVIDEDALVRRFTPVAERIFGYQAEEVLGRNVRMLMPEAPSALHDEHVKRYLRSGEARVIGVRREVVARRRDGTQFPMELGISVYVLAGRKRFVGVVRDISERKEVERMKAEFVSVVSHELRTPLTSIRGSLGLILGAMSQDLPARVKSLLEIAQKNCERLILLINDILDIDKMASGHMRFDMQPHLVEQLVHRALQATEAYAQRFDVCLVVDPIEAQLCIYVDEERMIQVLANLLSNAVKFSPTGGAVLVTAVRAAEHVRLSVIDRGTGIPDSFRDRVFERFSQADTSSSRQVNGTGLGLHIAKQIVQQMRGSIGFDSKVGEGTTFWIEFPLTDAVDPAPIPLVTAPVTGVRPRVLHVEDDADLHRVIGAAMQSDADLSLATSLQQALRLLKSQRYDLILLEIGLPDGSGLQLLEHVHTLDGPAPPVVLLCAEAPPADACLDAAAILVKTRVSEQNIVETILRVLRHPTTQQAAGQLG